MRTLDKGADRPEDGFADRLASAALGGALCLTLLLAACTSKPPPQSSLSPSQSGSSASQGPSAAATDNAPATPAGALEAAPAIAENAVSQLRKDDPGSPEALNDRLEFAGQLIEADDANCQLRLRDAQMQLDAFSADPSATVVLPLGAARSADLQYRLHSARASCGADSKQRDAELHAALAAAEQAVGLYRDALDYNSMAVMQFNVGVTQHLLGDYSAAFMSLKKTIDMDGEFGLLQDVGDNLKLLAPWARDARLAANPTYDATFSLALAQPRRVNFKQWTPADARVTVAVDETTVIDGNMIHGRARRTFAQHARKDWNVWLVSYDPGNVDFDVAQWPHEVSDVRELVSSLQRALIDPGYVGNGKGEFVRVVDPQAFATQQLKAARALVLDHLDPERGEDKTESKELSMLRTAFHPSVIWLDVAEEYNFQVGMWVGATLEQGLWYKLVAPLTLPGVRQVLGDHDIEFAYTRDVPCTAAAAAHSCVEIVVHAKPQSGAIKDFVDEFNPSSLSESQAPVHYWATTYIRLVTDPETLAVREYEVRRYWHISDKKAVKERAANSSERILTTFTY